MTLRPGYHLDMVGELTNSSDSDDYVREAYAYQLVREEG
jgi:hypothetical protein